MGPVAAVRKCLANYITFEGRASRSEFWWFALFCPLVTYVVPAAVYLAAPAMERVVGITSVVILAALLLPNWAVAARRLHDTDRSAWHLLWIFVPFFGSIVLLLFWCKRGTDDDNRYGAPPA